MTTPAFANNRFSITDLIDKVRDITLEHPQTIYEKPEPEDSDSAPPCSYMFGHSLGVGDGCLFGQILPLDFVQLDMQADIYEVLVDHIGLPNDQIHTGDRNLDDYEERTQEMDWIADVQSHQDVGWTWGASVKEADINYPLD